eukprot:54108_1
MAVFNVHLGYIGATIVQFSCVSGTWLIIKYPQRVNITDQEKKFGGLINTGVSWSKIVATKEGYESFANFLEREFSIENILFVTEYIQLKKAMLTQADLYNQIIDELKLKYELNLPDSIPLSLITKNFNDEIEVALKENESNMRINSICFKAMHQIFCKYIFMSSTLEVNISSSTRMGLHTIFVNNEEDKSVEKILPLIENAVMEISHLMNDSFSRFTKQTVFTELYNISTS